MLPEIQEKRPAVVDEFERWLPRHPKSGCVARGLLRGFLAGGTDGERYLTAGELVLTELVSNAVQHARTAPGRLVFVRFERSPGALRIEVHDASSERPVVRVAGVDAESGRGLWLVDQLSLRWGCCPRAGGVGKAMWAIVGPAGGDRGLSGTGGS